MSAAVQQGKSAGALQLARARENCGRGTARMIEQRFLQEYRGCMLDTFAEPADVSLALDASRVGKPATETLYQIVWHAQADRGGALPPQA